MVGKSLAGDDKGDDKSDNKDDNNLANKRAASNPASNLASRFGCLLLTRLHEESLASAVRLRRRGWSVRRAPLLSLEGLPAPDLVQELSRYAALIVTSKSALRMLAKIMSTVSLQNDARSSLSLLSLYAVGEQSAALAKRTGFRSVRVATGTLASLAREVRRHHPKNLPILHLCGKHRKGKLVESLQKAGYNARTRVLYEAVAVQSLPRSAYNLLKSPMPSSLYASLFYSPRTADVFATLYTQAFGEQARAHARLRFFCLSSDIGARLKQKFPCARIVCASKPCEASLFAALDEAVS